jgi:hypothetical protein
VFLTLIVLNGSWFVGFAVLTAVVMKSTIFWDIMPCSPLKVNRELPPAFTLVSCLAYSSTLKVEAICSSETSVRFQRTTRRYIPGDSTLRNLVWAYPPVNITRNLSQKLETYISFVALGLIMQLVTVILLIKIFQYYLPYCYIY